MHALCDDLLRVIAVWLFDPLRPRNCTYLSMTSSSLLAVLLETVRSLKTMTLHASVLRERLQWTSRALRTAFTVYITEEKYHSIDLARMGMLLRCSSLKFLRTLHVQSIHAGDLHLLLGGVRACHTLTSLAIYCRLSRLDVFVLQRSLLTYPNLTALTLQNGQLQDSGVRFLAPHIRKLSKLAELNLNGNSLSEEGMRALAPLPHSLRRLYVQDNALCARRWVVNKVSVYS